MPLAIYVCSISVQSIPYIKNNKKTYVTIFMENKQFQTSKNITITAQMPFTTIDVVGCHCEEAGCRVFSRPFAHQVSPFHAPIRCTDSSTRYSMPSGGRGRENVVAIATK